MDTNAEIRIWQSKEYPAGEICEAAECFKQTLYNAINWADATRD